MKKLIHFALALISFTSFAQSDAPASPDNAPVKKKMHCSRIFFDLSTGINNNGGLLGLGVDYHVTTDISINAGVGTQTSWGYKLYGGVKCYFKPCHRGWALGGGATHSTGMHEYTLKLETTQSASEPVTLNCLPQTNIFAAAYHNWRLGRNRNRIYLQLGWSVPVTTEKFRQVYGNPITSESAGFVRFLAPGGPIVGLGFSFGG